MRSFPMCAALMAVGLSSVTAHASEPGPGSNDTIVVTATRTMRQAAEIPASVSVVREEIIDASATANPDELLRSLSGVSVMRPQGIGQGMPAQINIRGIPGAHRILLLADGVPLNEISSGFLSINEIPMSAIGRMEVIRGPFSSLYGTDAFGGVVNVITKEGGKEPEIEVRGGIGNGGYRNYGIEHSAGTGSVRYRLDLDYRNADNYLGRDTEIRRNYDYASGRYIDAVIPTENRDYSDWRGIGKVWCDLSEKTVLELTMRGFEGTLGYGTKSMGPVYPTPEDNITRMRTVSVGANVVSEYSANTDLRFGCYYRGQTRELWSVDLSHYQEAVPVYVRSYLENAGTEWQAEVGFDKSLGEAHVLSAGAEFKNSGCEFSPLKNDADGTPLPSSSGADESVRNIGVYLQDEIRLADNWKTVVGARMDDHSEFGPVVSPRAGLLWSASERTMVRVSVGRAFRAPTLVELFQPPMSFGYVTFVPNPDLKPEYVTATDLEIEHRLSPTLAAKLGAFYNRMTDLIEDKASGDVLTNDNVQRARSAGGEAGIEWKTLDWLSCAASFTRQDAVNSDTGGKLDYVPDTTASVRLLANTEAGKWNIEGSLSYTYVGSRGFVDWASSEWYPLDGYSRVDLSVKCTYRDLCWIKAGVQNALDEEYQESLMTPLGPGRLAVLEAGVRY